MPGMASDLGYPVHLISAVINKHFKMNFNEFINKLRVQYIIANKNNEDWKNLTLEAISCEAGFNSRSTFISAFKKETGKTPSQFFSMLQ